MSVGEERRRNLALHFNPSQIKKGNLNACVPPPPSSIDVLDAGRLTIYSPTGLAATQNHCSS